MDLDHLEDLIEKVRTIRYKMVNLSSEISGYEGNNNRIQTLEDIENNSVDIYNAISEITKKLAEHNQSIAGSNLIPKKSTKSDASEKDIGEKQRAQKLLALKKMASELLDQEREQFYRNQLVEKLKGVQKEIKEFGLKIYLKDEEIRIKIGHIFIVRVILEESKNTKIRAVKADILYKRGTRVYKVMERLIQERFCFVGKYDIVGFIKWLQGYSGVFSKKCQVCRKVFKYQYELNTFIPAVVVGAEEGVYLHTDCV